MIILQDVQRFPAVLNLNELKSIVKLTKIGGFLFYFCRKLIQSVKVQNKIYRFF